MAKGLKNKVAYGLPSIENCVIFGKSRMVNKEKSISVPQSYSNIFEDDGRDMM